MSRTLFLRLAARMETQLTEPPPAPGIHRVIRTRPHAQPRARPVVPTVSVVIPCFDYGRFLQAAVDSCLRQTGVEVDVVIVDDASTDDSLAIARRLRARHPQVSLIAHGHNRGPVATFNDGLRLARGEFLVRLDADDMLTPGALARATALAAAFPSVGLIYGHPLHFRHEPPAARTGVRSWTVWPGRQWLADRCRDGLSVITAPEVVMRRSVVELVGGQQPLPHTHDTEMWLRIAAFADVARVDGPDQAWHRDHPDSLSAAQVDQVSDLYDRALAFDTLFDGLAGTLPQAPSLRAMAHRAIAREALRNARHRFDRGRADEHAVTSLVALALRLEPACTASPEWRALQRRVALGSARPAHRPGCLAAAARHRLDYEIKRRRWARTGTFNRTRPLPGAMLAPARTWVG